MEVTEMTNGMRWRVLVLQAGLIGILVFCAGFLFWGNSFIHNQITTELTAQQIFFPDDRRSSQGLREQLHRRPPQRSRQWTDLFADEREGAGEPD